MTTDLSLSLEQIIEYYGVRWKLEAGFKEIKQEIGSSKSQTWHSVKIFNRFALRQCKHRKNLSSRPCCAWWLERK